jgi:hypothetical protein
MKPRTPVSSGRNATRAARETEIRKLYPTLSEKQIEQKLFTEFPPVSSRQEPAVLVATPLGLSDVKNG